jgi:competence protein ComEC
VLPTLRALGIGKLDVLMISHGDNDHAGGAPAVAKAYPDALVFAGEPSRMRLPSAQCRSGQSWDWDGVKLTLLNPAPNALGAAQKPSDNNRSCVLLVEGKAGRLLLTGDIGASIEGQIAAQVGAGAPLVLVVPHHGSKTSSSTGFLTALQPRFALVSAGWRNRFGHPNPQIVQRYAAQRITLVNTADVGAIQAEFGIAASPRIVSTERVRQRRYWRE